MIVKTTKLIKSYNTKYI